MSASIEWLMRLRVVVAGDDQRDEEQVELQVVEPLAVDLGVDQGGHQVVAGVDPAVGGHLSHRA